MEALESPRTAVRRVAGGALDTLDADSLSHVLSYCDSRSLTAFGALNKFCRKAGRATHLWAELCLRAWRLPLDTPLSSLTVSKGQPSLPSLFKHIHAWPRELVMPSVTPPPAQEGDGEEEGEPQAPPEAVPAFRVMEDGVVQYTGGQPGVGNRSIRSRAPFPALPHSEGTPHACATGVQGMIDHMSRMLSCLCQPRYPICGVPQPPADKPAARGKAVPPTFSAPRRRADGRLDVTPRSLAYYEVSIRALEQRGPPPGHPDDEENSNSCVAVGLAPGDFPLEGMMPGWSKCSYALHSDDGAIFHAAGIKLRYFSSSFGAGDTVGCGVDYATREIFFTLNGDFLGVAFRDVKGTLFPTIGIDALHPIAVNFGERPFAFGLDSYAAARDAWLARSGPDAHAE